MLYTVVPMDQVLSFDSEIEYNYEERNINGELVQVTKCDEKNYSVVRIISTNPNAFLRPEFQPGHRI
jgi:hypothetical protein